MKQYQPRNKKGLAGTGLLIIVLAIFGVIGLLAMFTGYAKFGSTGLTVAPSGETGSSSSESGSNQLTFTEDTTVTFSSQDAYAQGTDAGTSNFVIQLGGDRSFQVADDGTDTASPNDEYIVLIGNATQGLTAGTSYYPTWVTGSIPDKGTYTVNANQYLSGGASQMTFVFFNENDQVNTAQSIGANAQKTVRWRITANDNTCIGNPTAGGDNLMSYTFNNTIYSEVTQLDSSSNAQTAVSTPNSVVTRTQHSIRTYTWPVVCDNADVQRKVLLKTLVDPDSSNYNVNMTVSDITVDYNADTLEKIVGVADEDNNDIGIADFAVAGLQVS